MYDEFVATIACLISFLSLAGFVIVERESLKRWLTEVRPKTSPQSARKEKERQPVVSVSQLDGNSCNQAEQRREGETAQSKTPSIKAGFSALGASLLGVAVEFATLLFVLTPEVIVRLPEFQGYLIGGIIPAVGIALIFTVFARTPLSNFLLMWIFRAVVGTGINLSALMIMYFTGLVDKSFYSYVVVGALTGLGVWYFWRRRY